MHGANMKIGKSVLQIIVFVPFYYFLCVFLRNKKSLSQLDYCWTRENFERRYHALIQVLSCHLMGTDWRKHHRQCSRFPGKDAIRLSLTRSLLV